METEYEYSLYTGDAPEYNGRRLVGIAFIGTCAGIYLNIKIGLWVWHHAILPLYHYFN
jgi:hypothetical protein